MTTPGKNILDRLAADPKADGTWDLVLAALEGPQALASHLDTGAGQGAARHPEGRQSGHRPEGSGDRSGGPYERRLDSPGHFDRDEPLSGVEVVLPALVDDPDVAIFLGVGVRSHQVDLVALQRRLVAFVADAHDETPTRLGHGSVQVSLPLHFSRAHSTANADQRLPFHLPPASSGLQHLSMRTRP